MKADNKVQRDEWVAALKNAIEPFIIKSGDSGSNSSPLGVGGLSNGASQSQTVAPSITLTKLPANKMNLSKQRSITLNQITDQLVKSKEQMNQRIGASDQAFQTLKSELKKLEGELPAGKQRERVVKIIDMAQTWQKQ
jgi:hypothetical protein